MLKFARLVLTFRGGFLTMSLSLLYNSDFWEILGKSIGVVDNTCN